MLSQQLQVLFHHPAHQPPSMAAHCRGYLGHNARHRREFPAKVGSSQSGRGCFEGSSVGFLRFRSKERVGGERNACLAAVAWMPAGYTWVHRKGEVKGQILVLQFGCGKAQVPHGGACYVVKRIDLDIHLKRACPWLSVEIKQGIVSCRVARKPDICAVRIWDSAWALCRALRVANDGDSVLYLASLFLVPPGLWL